MTTTRRQLLGLAGGGLAAALAGCSALGGDGADGGSSADLETVTAAPVPERELPTGRLEIRTALEGDGERAMADLAAAFEAAVDGVNPVLVALPGADERTTPDGGAVDYRRLGAALSPWAGRDALLGLAEIWRDLQAVVPRGVATTCHVGGELVAVPQAVHRLNTLFYNPAALADAGVDPEQFTTIRDLADAPGGLASFDRPFASRLRSRRDLVALWESLLSARLVFPGQYNDMVTGSPGDSELPVRRSVRDLDAALSLLSASGERDLRSLLDGVLDGTVGFVRAPTRAASHLVDSDGEYGRDWAVMPVFASPWAVTLVVEGFVVPRVTAERTTPRAFVRFASDQAASRRFSRTYGSLPARIDVTPTHHRFYEDQARQYRNATMYAPSIAYGQAVRPAIRERIARALVTFRTDRDVETVARTLLDALADTRAL